MAQGAMSQNMQQNTNMPSGAMSVNLPFAPTKNNGDDKNK